MQWLKALSPIDVDVNETGVTRLSSNKSISSNSWSLCKSLASFSPDVKLLPGQFSFIARLSAISQKPLARPPLSRWHRLLFLPQDKWLHKNQSLAGNWSRSTIKSKKKRKKFSSFVQHCEICRCFTGISGQFGDKNPNQYLYRNLIPTKCGAPWVTVFRKGENIIIGLKGFWRHPACCFKVNLHHRQHRPSISPLIFFWKKCSTDTIKWLTLIAGLGDDSLPFSLKWWNTKFPLSAFLWSLHFTFFFSLSICLELQNLSLTIALPKHRDPEYLKLLFFLLLLQLVL